MTNTKHSSQDDWVEFSFGMEKTEDYGVGPKTQGKAFLFGDNKNTALDYERRVGFFSALGPTEFGEWANMIAIWEAEKEHRYFFFRVKDERPVKRATSTA